MRGHWRDFDWLLLALVLAVCALGIAEIASATAATKFAGVYMKQIYFLMAGLLLLFGLSRVDYKLWLESSPWMYFASIAALTAVLLVGKTIFHSRRWIPIAGTHLQVSEFVKLVLILAVARYFAENRSGDLGVGDIAKVGAMIGVPMALVLLEPDLGTALTYLPIVGMGLLLGGLRWRHFFLILMIGALVLPVGWHFLHGYQKHRVQTFLNPQSDPRGSGYQLRQSKIAVGSGGLWGKGASHGTQTRGAFLPVPQTDFIFAAFSEEHGFLGAMLTLALYFVILMRLVHDAQLAPDRGGAMIIMGVVAVLAFHVLVNVGMVVGLMPVTGIPLPLMSSGGSSMLFMFAALGLVMNIRMARFVN